MTEEEARAWLISQDVSRETLQRLEQYVACLGSEAGRQNLISTASFEHVWSRHIVDSAQLLEHARPGHWIDIGTGAGMPGLIVAILGSRLVTLVEPRRRRATFLREVADVLGINNLVNVVQTRVEAIHKGSVFQTISARAYAPLDRLFGSAYHLADINTRWILPKGRTVLAEVEAARETWHGDFVLVPSVTDPEGSIVVASGILRGERR